MANVTNKHDAKLNIAGVDIAPGKTAFVEDRKLETWMTGNAAKVWYEKGLIEIEGSSKKDEKAAAEGDGSGLPPGTIVGNGSNVLTGAGTAMGGGEGTGNGQPDPADERQALLEEARKLGLNPNANTGTEKLKTLIAERKAG